MPLVDITDRPHQNTSDSMPVSGLQDRMEAGYKQLLSDNRVDLLTLYYPKFSTSIERARSYGYADDEISNALMKREKYALLYHDAATVNAALGRTPEGMKKAMAVELRRNIGSYVKASGLDENEVRNRMSVAEFYDMPPSMLINDKELYEKLTNNLKERGIKVEEGIWESGVRGFYASDLADKKNKIMRDVMYGITPYTPEIREQIAAIDKELEQYAAPLRQSFLNKGAEGVGGFLDLMRRTAVKGSTYGTIAATVAGLAGIPFTGGLSTVGAGLTIPGAYGMGYAFGSALEMFETEGGSAMLEYLDMKDKDGKPMDFHAAQVAALTVGLANAVIEQAQISDALKPIGKLLGDGKTMKGLLSNPNIASQFIRLGKEYAGNVTSETAEEIAQKAVTIIGGEAAKLMSGRPFEHISMEEAVKELAQEGEEALPTMALIALPGLAANTVTTIQQNRQDKAEKTALSEAIKEWENATPEERAAKEREAQEAIIKEANKSPLFRTEEAENIRNGLKQRFIEDGGMDEEQASANSDLLTAFAINMKERNPDADVTLEDMANIVVQGFEKSFNDLRGAENYDQIIGERGAARLDAADAVESYAQSMPKAALADMDKRYMAAVEAGDMETAQKIVDARARDMGYISDDEYRMNHRAPNSHDEDTSVTMADARQSDIVPADYWTTPRYYQHYGDEYASFYKIIEAIDKNDRYKAEGKGPARIWMYRAVPKGVKEDSFRNGDWITPSREYAQSEGAGIPGGYRIIAQRVDIDKVWWDANSINEWGYDDGKNYTYKNTKNNRKLTDAVVRDADGNIVPPSKRFNSRKTETYYQNGHTAEGQGLYNGLRLPFDPAELRTESGKTIEEAAKSDMLVTPDGSKALGRIEQAVAEFPAGEIQANAGAVQHMEERHGEEIRSFHYDNAQSLLLDVLNNYTEIRRGDGNALILSAPGDAKHSVKSVVSLSEEQPGIYRVNDAGIVRNDYLDKKELLYTRSEPIVTGPDTGLAGPSEDNLSQGTPQIYARQQSNSENSLQRTGETVNATTSWLPGKAWETPSMIQFFKTANASTGPHELGHHILRVMFDIAKLDGASAQLKDDINTILEHAGVTMDEFENDADKRRVAHEYFARSWETYLSEGKAPTEKLQGVFDRIRQWMIEVYHDVVQALGIELSDDMRAVFDRILATPDELAEQRRIGDMALEEITRREEMKKTSAEISELETQEAVEADNAAMTDEDEQKALDDIGAWFDEQAAKAKTGGESYDQIIGERGAARLDAADAGHRIDNLGIARQMEEAGKDAKTVWLATGWQRGTNGKWNYEVLDGEMKIFPEAVQREVEKLEKRFIYGETLTKAEKERITELRKLLDNNRKFVEKHDRLKLGDIYDAPELYKAYPALKNMDVEFRDIGKAMGGYSPMAGKIILSRDFVTNNVTRNAKSTLIHEIQHAIQHIEGFETGGGVQQVEQEYADYADTLKRLRQNLELWQHDAGSREFVRKSMEEIREGKKTLEQHWKDLEEFYAASPYAEQIRKNQQAIDDLVKERREKYGDKDTPGEIYLRLVGEVQARNAETRMNMTAEERRQKLLSETEDVSREDQIVLRDALGRAESYDQEALHATPYEFDRFMLEHIGSGDGNMAEGYGLYYSDDERVAGLYEKQFKDERGTGRVYKAEIPENDVLLDRDATMEEQPEVVKEAARAAVEEFGEDFSPETLKSEAMSFGTWGGEGELFYNKLSEKLGGDKEASMWLKDHGVPGARYAANEYEAMDEADGTETGHNYVIWDDNAVSMIEGYEQSRGNGTTATDAIEDYARAMEDYDNKVTAREYVDQITKLIRQNGGLRLDDFIGNMGEELAKELRKKWPGLFRNTTQGPQLDLDQMTQQLQANGINIDVQGLVNWLSDTLNEKPVKPVPPALSAENLKAAVDKYGAERVIDYLSERQKYLEGQNRKETDADTLRAINKELRAIDRLIAGDKAAREKQRLREHYEDWISRLKAENREKLAAEKQRGKERTNNALEKLKQRYAAMLERKKELRKLGVNIDKTVRAINRMADAKSINVDRAEEIKALLKDYDLKRRNSKTKNRRAWVSELLELNNLTVQEAMRLNQEELDFLGIKLEDLRYIGTTTLDEMTFGDLKQLRAQVEEIYQKGRQEYDEWAQNNHEKAMAMREGFVDSLAKTKSPEAKAITESGDLYKQYDGLTGFLAKLKDGLYSSTLTPDQLWDWLDKGRGKYKGAFIDMWNMIQDGHDRSERQVNRRVQDMRDGLKKLGFTRRQLNKVIGDFGQFGKTAGTINGIELSWSQVMGLYLGMRNPEHAKAIIYGNFVNGNGQGPVMSVEQAENTVRQFINLLSPEMKQAAELITKDFDENFDRVNEALKRNFNMSMDRVENYTPMRRLERQSRQGLIDIETAETIKKGESNAPIIQQVEKGFMNERQDISEERQRGVSLDVWNNWMNAVRAEEDAASLGGIAKNVTSALLSEGEDGRAVSSMIKDKFGKSVWGTAANFISDAFTDRQRTASDVLTGMSGYFMRARSVASVCWNGSVWLIQTTSYPLFLAFHSAVNGPVSMITTLGKFAAHPQQFLENVYELNPQLRNTGGFKELNALRRDAAWGSRKWQRVLDMGYVPCMMLDRWTKAAGWYSVYEASREQGMSEQTAIHKADRAVRITQPASYGRDQARLWRQPGIMKLMLQFTSATAAHFNMTVYDVVQGLASKEWNGVKHAFSTVAALVATACLTKAFRDGLPGNDDEDDDDPQSLGSWAAEAVTKQFVNSWPLFGHEIANAFDTWVLGKRKSPEYSVFVTPLARLQRAYKLANKEDADDNDAKKAAWYVVEALATSGLAPIPATGIRRLAEWLTPDEEE